MAAFRENFDAPSLLLFFRELVRGALERQKLDVPDGVEYYLVNLLQDCARSDDLYAPPSEGFREEPLAFLYCRAAQATDTLKIGLLKKVGDFSLYISGFFPESFDRQMVDLRYYIGMGESAYGNLSILLGRHAAFAEIFGELARRFVAYVDILSEVSESGRSRKNDSHLLRLYETWLKTGSERAKRLLSEEGIVPVNDLPLKTQ